MSTRSRIMKRGSAPPAEGIALVRPNNEGSEPMADLTVHRRDGKVVALEINCACGRTLLVDCVYEDSVRCTNLDSTKDGDCRGISK